MIQRFLYFVLILLLCGLLLNCGRTGPLYLPVVPTSPAPAHPVVVQ